ncbi:hypothetical protein B0H14DRAFT_3431543 [Mycena olivaceomarginata]|nr:hypothetical protein B0H14DRAFT_3431543 [Mycena olivaceomarginata]
MLGRTPSTTHSVTRLAQHLPLLLTFARPVFVASSTSRASYPYRLTCVAGLIPNTIHGTAGMPSIRAAFPIAYTAFNTSPRTTNILGGVSPSRAYPAPPHSAPARALVTPSPVPARSHL